MARLNRVELIGRLGKDPELKYTTGGTAVCSISLATDEPFKDASGKWDSRPEWHRLVVWNKQGENAAQWLKKGSLVFVEGRLQTRNWEKDGQKHYMTEIVVSNFQKLDSKKDDAAPADDDKLTSPSDEQKPLFENQTPKGEDLPF